mmetsp:Transcript_25538/g.47629  ORF Transcript_25538/g.47629 Transcript_25538/m.47629 type:complete len:155 (-) Transcript_25538:37-501(-)
MSRVSIVDSKQGFLPNDTHNKKDTVMNIITLNGRRYIQNEPNTVALQADTLHVNDAEFRFWIHNIVRRGRQVASLMTLGTFLCFLAAFFGYVDKKPGSGWSVFVWSIFVLGMIAECSVLLVTGCTIPQEAAVHKCVTDVAFLIVFLFCFMFLIN